MSKDKNLLFAFLDSILENKNPLMSPDNEEEYIPFVINKGLSQHIDCLVCAQEMNLMPHLDRQLQYDYHLNIVRPKKRPKRQWLKPSKDDDIELIQMYFKVNAAKAKDIKLQLKPSQLIAIKEIMNKGGIKNE
jgi:hypothetical protein